MIVPFDAADVVGIVKEVIGAEPEEIDDIEVAVAVWLTSPVVATVVGTVVLFVSVGLDVMTLDDAALVDGADEPDEAAG